MPRAVIDGVASWVPENRLTNDDLADRLGTWSADRILAKTGIRERRIAAPDECSSDLAVRAAQRLIGDGRLDPNEIDYILLCTQSPDFFLPTTACLIQERLGAPRTCGALDFNLGCSGYVYGLSLAKGLIESGQARCVLLLTAETYSKYINPKDRSVRSLFGDGAAATVVRAQEGTEAGIGQFLFGTDGRGGKNLIVPAGASRLPASEATAVETEDADGNVRSQNDLAMNGREIFRFAIETVPRAIKTLLERAKLAMEDIDFVIFHQATTFMLSELTRKIHIPAEKVPLEIEDIGNTVSSTIPIVIERLAARNALKTGHRLLLVGFGVGYSWAGGLVTWK